MSRFFVVELVAKPESPELVSDDALEGWAQKWPRSWLLQDSANEDVNLVQGPVELLETRDQLWDQKAYRNIWMFIVKITTTLVDLPNIELMFIPCI